MADDITVEILRDIRDSLKRVEQIVENQGKELVGLRVVMERGFSDLRADFRRGDIRLGATDDRLERNQPR